MLYDLAMIFGAFYLSVSLAEEHAIPDIFYKQYLGLKIFAIVIGVQFSVFYFLGLYKAILRFSSIPDLIRIIRGVSLAVPLSFLGIFLLNRLDGIPRTSFFLNVIILVMALCAGRLAYRIAKDKAVEKLKYISHQTYKRMLIIGAGAAGEKLLREISFNPILPLDVVGFVDDDSKKIGRSLRGVNIFGPIHKLPALINFHKIQYIIIAMPSANQEQIRYISKMCRELDKNIELKILPRMDDIINGPVSLQALRNIEPEDLLGRKARDLNIEQMSAMIKDKVILITGAGGSIGHELCKQVAKLQPKTLVLFELTELFLYELELALKHDFPQLEIVSIIGDVRNLNKLESVFFTHKPEVVFHAAAYKHVPLMELNPYEAIRTNVLGTQNVASISHKHGVDRFVLISTDKAINHTNIMGASKRIAELICMQSQRGSKTKFMMVRFGNVLGSSGSVIPLFKKQIERGGPVTVTHPEMRRYFMSIPEATQLVIQAGSLGNGGEVMVLDMGEPMKIKDLAAEMISLAGYKPEIDIAIEYTGLRPGEKLFEELFHADEMVIATQHPMVKIAQTENPKDSFQEDIRKLLNLSEEASVEEIKLSMKSLVPEYNYSLAPEDVKADPTKVFPIRLDKPSNA
jgi:FlaA1/EpsC-like NDP-sugar epimerase